MVLDRFASNFENSLTKMPFPMAAGLRVTVKGLLESTHGPVEFAVPLLGPDFSRDLDPSKMEGLEVGLKVGLLGVGHGCFVAR